ncbi:MAG: hypothetical protein AAF722_04850 [Cyanobacteria bacterium P01_C01_bin.70]
MTNLREKLNTVLQLKEDGGGFHYVQQAQSLRQTAQHTRQWSTLLRTPIGRWKSTLADTRYVLDELKAMGID